MKYITFALIHLVGRAYAATSSGVSEELANTLKAALAAEDATHAPPALVHQCSMSSSNACPLSDMPLDETTLVYPGGKTRCIFSTSSDFAFQVVPGDTDKLLLFFQGGGACWDKLSTSGDFCTTDANPSGLNGVFDRENPANPFAGYTVVQVLYCSGDLHAGNVTRPYTDSAGEPVVQVGYENTKAAVAWAKANLDAKLDKFVVSGCSAGSLGSQAWANDLLQDMNWTEAAVVVDSYAGVFPNGTQGPLIESYGMCNLGILESDLVDSCNAQTLSIQDVFTGAMANYPNVGFANVNSKADTTQMAFYAAIAATEPTDPNSPDALTEDEYENEVNKIFERYNKQPNYVSYLITSSQHCYFPSSLTYTADTTGKHGDGQGGQVTLATWASGFPVPASSQVATECDGEELTEPNWSGHTYCDAEQQGKVYAP